MSHYQNILIRCSLILLLGSCEESSTTPLNLSQDPRAFQHGIDFISLPNHQHLLVWASSGLPPVGEDDDGEWSHDVYYSFIDSTAPKINPVNIISASGAQEPVSTAISANETIMMTMEDAYQAQHNLAQTYAVYDQTMQPIKAYQNVVFDGGHSGHIAAIGHYFTVFYSDDWVAHGGVDNLGSGDDVLLKTYDSQGNFIYQKPVAVGDKTRDWWPMIAGGERHALLLWQRLDNDETHAKLMYQILDVETQQWLTDAIELMPKLKYYTYDAQYLAPLKRFLVTGVDDHGKGVAFLFTNTGELISQNTSLPPIIREAQPAISKKESQEEIRVVYPLIPQGLMVLSVSREDIRLEGTISMDYAWTSSGVDGIFLNPNEIYFASLSPTGIKTLRLNLSAMNRRKESE